MRVFAFSVRGEEVQCFVEEAALVHDRLRRHGVGRAPSGCRPVSTGLGASQGEGTKTYETFRMPDRVILMLLTDMDSGLVRTSFPVSSVGCDSDGSP
jgi:hypothetical protein